MDEEAYPYAFYNARWYGYVGLLFGLCFLLMAIFGLVNRRFNELAGLFFLIIAAAFGWIGWRMVANKEPALRFGRTGIWTLNLGAIQWQDVLLEFGRINTSKAGSFDTLKILDRQTGRQIDAVVISAFSESVENVKILLQSCKRAKFK
jgi:thiol:disulfide interchange protein